jgi:hypothetical protein
MFLPLLWSQIVILSMFFQLCDVTFTPQMNRFAPIFLKNSLVWIEIKELKNENI